jgi:signal transduction histidine kinase
VNNFSETSKELLDEMKTAMAAGDQAEATAIANDVIKNLDKIHSHGIRAKNPFFNAAIKTDFDPTIGNVNIIPQDIGRVLLNLINNALYAVNEKKKQLGDGYEPTVTVSTRLNQPMSQLANKLIVSVQDNGFGIPETHRNKIFQPFFTTKPTGEGTGLGLSLSYDIIKAHGGEIRVNSKEGEGTEFQI